MPCYAMPCHASMPCHDLTSMRALNSASKLHRRKIIGTLLPRPGGNSIPWGGGGTAVCWEVVWEGERCCPCFGHVGGGLRGDVGGVKGVSFCSDALLVLVGIAD